MTELNPELGICRVDFEKEKRVAVPLGAAGKFLTPLQADHVLREKFAKPDALRAEARIKRLRPADKQRLCLQHPPGEDLGALEG